MFCICHVTHTNSKTVLCLFLYFRKGCICKTRRVWTQCVRKPHRYITVHSCFPVQYLFIFLISFLSLSCSVSSRLTSDEFNRYYSYSRRLGRSYRHPTRHPVVLPCERKEEVFATPACACQHSPAHHGGQRAPGLQQHHQAHLTPQPSPLTPVPVVNDTAVQSCVPPLNKLKQRLLTTFECWRGVRF